MNYDTLLEEIMARKVQKLLQRNGVALIERLQEHFIMGSPNHEKDCQSPVLQPLRWILLPATASNDQNASVFTDDIN
jgi:hypothetical protein